MVDVLPISLCMFVKNEIKNLRECVESVRPIIAEIVIVDTGSTDGTLELAKKITPLTYSAGLVDFGSIRTLTAHLASAPWVLMLDADETIRYQDLHRFSSLVNVPEGMGNGALDLDENGEVVVDSYAFPRKRWADRGMKEQVENNAYPDWQVRLFRNHINRRKITFVRRVHERVQGCIKTVRLPEGPVIQHFQSLNKDSNALKERQALYTELYNLDIADGVEHSEPPVVEMDKVK